MSRWSDEFVARSSDPNRESGRGGEPGQVSEPDRGGKPERDAESDRGGESDRDGESERGHVEPLAALVAVFAVGVALSTYAGVLDATLPTPGRNLADPTVERAELAVTDAGVVDPDALPAGLRAGPDGHRVNLTLDAAGRTWRAGPTPPPRADAADLAVNVRVGPGRIRPGELRAEVWT